MKSLSKIELHSSIRDINLKYNRVVVGSTLEALVYACLNNYPVIFSRLTPPRRFETFNHDEDLSIFGVQNKTKTIQTNFSEKEVGIDKLWLWERLYFYLSVAGLCPMIDNVASIRIDNNIIRVSTLNARLAKIHFNSLIVFDDFSVYGLGVPNCDNKLVVYDWFDVRSGMKHKYDQIEDTTDFVNHILFYPSERVSGEHNFKDAVSVSYLSKEQLGDFEFSDINARFKTLYMMKKNGIRGARNGRDTKDKTRYKYYSVKIENNIREIVFPKNIYKPLQNIDFNYDSVGDIIKTNSFKESYAYRICKRTCRS